MIQEFHSAYHYKIYILEAFFNQTTYNRWRKCNDDILATVKKALFLKLFFFNQKHDVEVDMTILWVPSLWHSVTPLWKILATPMIFSAFSDHGFIIIKRFLSI